MRGGFFVSSAALLFLRAVTGSSIPTRRLRRGGKDSIVEIKVAPTADGNLADNLEEIDDPRELNPGFMTGEEEIARLMQSTIEMSMSIPLTASQAPTRSPITLTAAPTSSPVATPAPTKGPEATLAPTKGPVATPAPVSSSPTVTPALVSMVPTPAPALNTSAPTSMVASRDQQIMDKCGVTAIERSRDILTILSGVSNPVELVTPSSPQFKARFWLDNIDPAIICAGSVERIQQRYRMALLYYQLGGPGWYNCRAAIDSEIDNTCLVEDVRDSRRLQQMMLEGSSNSVDAVEAIMNYRPMKRRGLQTAAPSDVDWSEKEATRWLNGSNECEWYGLDCGELYHSRAKETTDECYPVINIDLSANNLNGPLTEEILHFGDLEGYFLDGNLNITGTIPDVFDQMPKLKFLDFDDNELVGGIPNSLFTLSDLIAIDFNSNQLEGSLSESIGDLRNLEVLQLENNNLSGPLPANSLLNLQRLVALAVEGNLFTGSLEPLCDVRDERRLELEVYLQFMFAECGGDEPLVECSCCVCY